MFEDAHRCLATGGVLRIVIRTAQGAKSWQKRLAELFGNCETLAIESGYRVLQCVKCNDDL
jgi:16S rRNA (guanine1207-N2)-methyltransferase